MTGSSEKWLPSVIVFRGRAVAFRVWVYERFYVGPVNVRRVT